MAIKVSNVVITTLNVVTTLLAVAAIGCFIYLHFMNSSPTHCQRAVERPILVVGVALLVVSLLGLIGSSCRVSGLLWIYLVVLVLLILGWFVFSVFVFFVTNKGAGKAVSGAGFKEYRLGDYSHWLQKHVVNNKNWVQIRSCLVEAEICDSSYLVYSKNGADFLKDNLSPLQSGCCKPPTMCGFIRKNGTNWEAPEGGPASSDSDCTTWRNDKKTLCYNCMSCKAGMLANLRKEWRNFSILNAVIIVLLFVIYMVGCCAVHNNRHDHSPKYSPSRYP